MHFDYPYLALGVVENGLTDEGNGTLTPIFFDGLYNEELSWENRDQYDIGLDLDFLTRLGIVLDYYYRYTDDLLMQIRYLLLICTLNNGGMQRQSLMKV